MAADRYGAKKGQAMTDKPEPCPICGRKPVVRTGYKFVNIGCGYYGDYGHELKFTGPPVTDAIAAWNAFAKTKRNDTE